MKENESEQKILMPITVTLRLPFALVKSIKSLAEKEDRSLNNMTKIVLEKAMDEWDLASGGE